MDYRQELFAQCTPYLQWLKERDIIQNKEYQDTGKPIDVFPFSSCMDSVEQTLGGRADRGRNYLFVNVDGKLQEGAAALIAEKFSEHEETMLVYADEDYYGTLEELYQIEEHEFEETIIEKFREPDNGLFRGEPWLKPDFSPDTLESFFYVGNIFAVSGQIIEEMTDLFGGEILLCELVRAVSHRVAARNDVAHGADSFVHIPEVLYTNNRLSKKDELDGFAPEAFDKSDIMRIGGTSAKLGKLFVIIPSKDNPQMLKRCVETFEQCARDVDYELIIVDNGSADNNCVCIKAFLEERGAKYLYEKAEFNFSRMCNIGAKAADGDYLLFLNDDIEAAHNDGRWLTKMMRYAAMEHIGAVGMKLHYPDGDLIQHAGITNMGIGPAHKLGGMPDKGNLYHGHNLADYNMLAVTAACMMVSRTKFERAGGFDEELAVAYNDVEFCFRLYKMGLYNVQVNSAFLIHHESLSRGQDTTPEKQERLLHEKQRLYDKHPSFRANDPFYNPNLVQWEKDAAYHIHYQYSCDKPVKLEQVLDKKAFCLLRREAFRQKLERTNVYISRIYNKLTGADRHMFHIDGIAQEDGTVTITGWHVLRKQNNADLIKRLWIYDSHNIYEAELFPKLRRDVETLFAQEAGDTKNTALSGICVKFDAVGIPKGQYALGIAVKESGKTCLICTGQQIAL